MPCNSSSLNATTDAEIVHLGSLGGVQPKRFQVVATLVARAGTYSKSGFVRRTEGNTGDFVTGKGVSKGLSIWQPHRRIKRVTVTMKIKAQTRSSEVGMLERGRSRSICLAIEAVMSWLTLSKM